MRLSGLLPALLFLGCGQASKELQTPSKAATPDRKLRVISTDPVDVHLQAWECLSKADRCDIVHSGYVSVRTRRIVYLDFDGEERTVYDPDPADEPGAKEGLCPGHRSRPVGRLEHEARLLLEAADLLWNEDSAASIRAYQRLLADYPEFLKLLGSPVRIRMRAEQAD